MTPEGAKAMTWIKQHMALVILLLVLATGATLLITGRLQYIPAGSQENAEGTTGDEGIFSQKQSRVQGNQVVLDADEYKASGIRTAPVTKGSVTVFFQAPGEVQLAEGRIARVTPPVSGVVGALYKGVGDRVEKGSPLCLIESVELGDAESSYVSAEGEVAIAERNYTRWKQLFEKGLRTQNELIAVEAELTRARLKLEGALARLRGLGIRAEEIQALGKEGAVAVSNQYTVRSPIRGSVLQRNVTDGQSVAPSDQLFYVGDLSEVWVQTVAREQDLPVLRAGATAVIKLPNLPEAAFPGRVTYIGEQVDEKTRTVPLRILARNSRPVGARQNEFLLRPGLFTDVEIQTGQKRDVLVIPFAAVQSDGSHTYVFILVPGQQNPPQGVETRSSKQAITFERREVELGARNGPLVEVKGGLLIGDQVAVEHAYLLKGELDKSKVED